MREGRAVMDVGRVKAVLHAPGGEDAQVGTARLRHGANAGETRLQPEMRDKRDFAPRNGRLPCRQFFPRNAESQARSSFP